jgi:hypothetical protein
MPEVVTSAGNRLKLQTPKLMLTPLETAAADSLLEKLAASNNGEDCRNFAQAYSNIQNVAWERSCRNNYASLQAATPVDAPAEPATEQTPATTTKRTRASKATPEPTPAAAPAVDLGIGGPAPAAETPAPAATAPAAPAATGFAAKTYEEKCAEVKAAYVNKLRILTEGNAAEGNSFKDKVAEKIVSLGKKKISDPGEENIDEFYSFIVNVVPDKGPATPMIEI